MLTYNKLEELNIISNLLSESEKKLLSGFILQEKLMWILKTIQGLQSKISSSKTYKTNGQVEYTDFVFSVRFADTVSSGTTTSLNFVVSYVGFDLKNNFLKLRLHMNLLQNDFG